MTESPDFKLCYLPLFWSDLSSAVSYISDVLNNPKAAIRLVDSVEEKILSHLKMPTSSPVYNSTKDRALPYYWFEVGNYLVFYVVYDDVMEVRRFLYGSRDITRFLP